MFVKNELEMPYPRVCAHRGFNTIAPENTMPAFGAAEALGAEEIEFDLWCTKDGKIVSMHDADLSRVSDFKGYVWDYTYEELLKADFGIKFSENFRGLRIATFEEILQKFACRIIMNIHIKSKEEVEADYNCDSEDIERMLEFDDEKITELLSLIDKYNAKEYVYVICGDDNFLEKLRKIDSEIFLCLAAKFETKKMIERAKRLNCKKVQIVKEHLKPDMIEQAHKNGIKCNMFWSDEEEEAVEFLKKGIDTILTNDYLKIAQVVKKFTAENREE